MMQFDDFERSLNNSIPPEGSDYLQSLWHDEKGNWNKAHEIIQNIDDKNAAWIHAYLHRKEGDMGNADYWYRRAGRKRPDIPLTEEWTDIVKAFL